MAASAPLLAWQEPSIRFEETARRDGLRFKHQTRSFSGPKHQVLEMFTAGGASVAVADYDGDGDEDAFLTTSQRNSPNFLFRNEGDGTFSDVSPNALTQGNDEGSIVADALWFDYDNDTRPDLLVARFGTPLLFRNEGGGRFRDVTARSGLGRFANTIAAIAFDYDGDGLLDLLFGNYFRPVNLLDLDDPKVLPDNLDDAHNGGGLTLWRNCGKGRFEDATEKAGLSGHDGWTLDVGHGDFDNDGDPDFYAAGDYGTDRLFLNDGKGAFIDATLQALGGFDTKKGMNAEVADYDNDGLLDVYVTNITDEYMKECNMLWRNNGDGTFSDLARETGTCDTLWGWAAKFADFDNDGHQDLYAVNGLYSGSEESYVPALFEMIIREPDFSDLRNWPDIEGRTWSGYQKSKLFKNLGGGLFREMAGQAGVDHNLDGRGIGVADFDRDGRLDMIVTNADQRALYYRNRSPRAGHWVALRLLGDPSRGSNRDAIGSRVTLTAGGLTQIREVQGGNGYSSQSSKIVHFGLGSAEHIDRLEIRWPNGERQTARVPLDSFTTIDQQEAP